MSWSVKITILYLGFVGIIISLVVICFGHKTELVYKDYYARELQFQKQIDADNNATLLETPIQHQVNGKNIHITLPQELMNNDLEGKVHFMRPSDSRLDKEITLKPEPNGLVLIDGSQMADGVYKMQISLTSAGKNYYKEAVIRIK